MSNNNPGHCELHFWYGRPGQECPFCAHDRNIAEKDRRFIIPIVLVIIMILLALYHLPADAGEVYMQDRVDGVTIYDTARGTEIYIREGVDGITIISTDADSPLADEIQPTYELNEGAYATPWMED